MMTRIAQILDQLGRRLQNAAYVLRHPAYGVVRRQGGDRGLFRLLNEPWLPRQAIATVLDIGANEGRFIVTARCLLPDARVLAIEPNPKVAEELRRRFRRDPVIEVESVACSDTDGAQKLHVSRFSPASSLLAPAPAQLAEFPESTMEGSIEVPVRRLDGLMACRPQLRPPYLLKIDVQGAELNVLQGAAAILPDVAVIALEINLREFYQGQPPLDSLLACLRQHGFVLVNLNEPIRSRRNGEVLYFDAAFCRAAPG